MIIGIDCDEVLAETLDTLFATSHILRAYSTTKAEITSYNPLQTIKNNIPQELGTQIFWGLFASDEYRTIQPVLGAKEKLQQRKTAGHELILLTGRPLRFQDRTEERIHQQYPNLFSDFLFSSAYTDQEVPKSQLCQQKGIELVVEDNLFFVQDLAAHHIPCFLLQQPRNRDYTPEQYPGVIKVNSRKEIPL